MLLILSQPSDSMSHENEEHEEHPRNINLIFSRPKNISTKL